MKITSTVDKVVFTAQSVFKFSEYGFERQLKLIYNSKLEQVLILFQWVDRE